MTSVTEAAAAPRVIMKPYAPDPDGRGRKRLRLLIVLIVSGFCLFYGFAFALFAPYLLLPMMAPPLVLGLVVIWALPETRTAPTRTLVGLTFGFFVGLVMWPNYIAFAPPGLPWITMVRITGFPLALSLLICVSVSGEFRSRIAGALRAAPLVWQLLMVFLVIQLLTIVFSHAVGQSIDKFVEAQVSWTAIFFASVYVFLKPGRVERMAIMFWVMAIIVGAIGVLEWRRAGVLWAGHIPSFLKIPDPSVERALAFHSRDADGIYRTQSTFSTSLGLSEYIALTLPFVLQFAFGAYKPTVRLLAALSIPFMLFTVFISGSRLGTVGCLMSFFLYFLAWAILKWRENRQSLIAPAAIMSFPVAVIITGILIVVWPRLHVMVLGNGAAQSSTLARQEQLRMALPKLLTHPWGYGISMGADAVGFLSPSGVLTLDSYYITVAMEYGIIGFLVYFGFLVCSIVYAVRYRLTAPRIYGEFNYFIPLAIALANFFVVKSVFSQQSNHPIVFMFVGMIVALGARVRMESAATAA